MPQTLSLLTRQQKWQHCSFELDNLEVSQGSLLHVTFFIMIIFLFRGQKRDRKSRDFQIQRQGQQQQRLPL